MRWESEGCSRTGDGGDSDEVREGRVLRLHDDARTHGQHEARGEQVVDAERWKGREEKRRMREARGGTAESAGGVRSGTRGRGARVLNACWRQGCGGSVAIHQPAYRGPTSGCPCRAERSKELPGS